MKSSGMLNSKVSQESTILLIFITLGIFLRFWVMSLGHNFDFESYCIVGEIAGYFRNVYAETGRYNYGPIFFCIQGVLYRISELNLNDSTWTYRVLIVATLTIADLGITYFVAKRYSLKYALIFFLNPVSIIITGYHNQFDNIAILLALLTTLFYNNEKKLNKNDLGFVIMFALCLMTKHILFILPIFLLLRSDLNLKKKVIYVCIPPTIFLCSFLPFIILNKNAMIGVLNNVFLYRSYNNAPLLAFLYMWIGFPDDFKLLVYIGLMIVMAAITRKYNYEKQLLIYLISMVTFSSAIANQYLVIPVIALCLLNTKWMKYVYMAATGVYLLLQWDGLGFQSIVDYKWPGLVAIIGDLLVQHGHSVAAWILLIILIYILYEDKKHMTNINTGV